MSELLRVRHVGKLYTCLKVVSKFWQKKKKIPVIFLYENLRRYNAYTLFCTALPLKMGDVIDVIH